MDDDACQGADDSVLMSIQYDMIRSVRVLKSWQDHKTKNNEKSTEVVRFHINALCCCANKHTKHI